MLFGPTGHRNLLSLPKKGLSAMWRRLCRSKSDGKEQLCIRRVIFASWALFLSLCVLRGLTRAPEVSVCSFITDDLGLPCEEHLATTSDGYQLYLKRIPAPAISTSSARGKSLGEPILLMPGLADSSATWVVSGRSDSLGGVLHDAGFDVWLLEKRGRTPWRHERYTGQDLEFWDFSFDETVKHDLPALVDYVRRFTHRKVAAIVGHGEGAMIAMATLANAPETAAHVRSVVAFAPQIGSFGTVPEDALLPPAPQIPDFVVKNLHPALPLGFARLVFTGLCAHAPGFCWSTLCRVTGCSDADSYDPEVVGRVFAYYPRETSLKNLQHLIQCQHAERLQYYDYGQEKNMQVYGSPEPKAYDFSGLKTPLALYFGTKDLIVPEQAYERTKQLLPAKAIAYVNTTLNFGHQDYVWSSSAKHEVYEPVVRFVESHMSVV